MGVRHKCDCGGDARGDGEPAADDERWGHDGEREQGVVHGRRSSERRSVCQRRRHWGVQSQRAWGQAGGLGLERGRSDGRYCV